VNRNIGTFDSMLRLIVGAGLVGFALLAKDIPYSYLGWIGIVPVLTAIFGSCPLYSLLGVRTNT
jgi:Protein of unknown function (DUF2892)